MWRQHTQMNKQWQNQSTPRPRLRSGALGCADAPASVTINGCWAMWENFFIIPHIQKRHMNKDHWESRQDIVLVCSAKYKQCVTWAYFSEDLWWMNGSQVWILHAMFTAFVLNISTEYCLLSSAPSLPLWCFFLLLPANLLLCCSLLSCVSVSVWMSMCLKHTATFWMVTDVTFSLSLSPSLQEPFFSIMKITTAAA